jgi:hypothetical protein
VSTGTAPPLDVIPRRTAGAGIVESEPLLSRREAALRSTATTCLAGIALVQAVELPSLFAQGGRFAAVSLAAMALCLGVGFALAGAPGRVGQQLWQVVAATGVLVLAGWAAPRAFAIPGLADQRGHWTALPGGVCGALGAACLALASLAAPPTRASARGLATAVAVLLAFAPGVGVLLVALGPGPAGGETVLAAGAHVHSHAGVDETIIRYQPIPGGHGGRFVYRTAATPRPTALGTAILATAALVFVSGALGHLRRRSMPAER